LFSSSVAWPAFATSALHGLIMCCSRQDNWPSVAGIIEKWGAGKPSCVPDPMPSNCTGLHIRSDLAVFCSQYCSQRDHFLAAARPGATQSCVGVAE
jgi:hypothetical protein